MAELNYSILYVNIDFDTRSKEAFSTHNPFLSTDENFNKQDAIKRNVQMIKSKRLSGLDIESKDVIVIDEAHFFDDLLQFVNECLNKNKYVIIVSLIADFEGNKFGKALDLAPIKKCCLATYSKRIIESKKSIEIGGSEKYVPVCRFHYTQNQEEFICNSKIITIENDIGNKINKNIVIN